MITSARYLIVATLLLTAGVCPVSAQQSNRGLFRGLFGGAEPVIGREHVLDLTASGFFAYAKNIVEEDQDSIPEATAQGASAALTYQRQWKKAHIGAFASGGTAYVDERRDIDESPWVNRWNAGARAGYQREIGRRTSMSVNGNVGYSPYFGFGIGGFGENSLGQGIFDDGFSVGPDRVEAIPGLDHTVARQPSLNSTGNVTLSQRFTSKSSLDAYYSIHNVTFLGGETEGFGDQLGQTIGVRYRQTINRYVSAHAGYGYVRSTYAGDDAPIVNHAIDAGVDGGYGREFQITRRTTFSFDTRSNVFVADQLSGDDTFDPVTRFFVGGSAGLAHRWGRSWQALLRYERSAGLIDGFREPVFSNSARASVRGVPLRRLDFMADVTYITGEVGFTTIDRGFSTTTSMAQLRFAVLRNLAAYAQYFYYRYDFEKGVTLPGSIPPVLDRHGGSVGLTVWLPLL